MSANKLIKVSELPPWPYWVIDKVHVLHYHLLKEDVTIDPAGNIYRIPEHCVVANIDEYKFMPPPGLLEPSSLPDFYRLKSNYNSFMKDTLIHVKSNLLDGLVYLHPYPFV